MTPLGRSLVWLRRQGFIACAVERWLPRCNRRRDAFGFGDILAASPRDGVVLLVQATTAAHVAGRLDKAREIPELAGWLRAGAAFEVHGWFLRAGRWHVRRVAVAAGDLAGVVLSRRPGRRRRSLQRELFA